MAFTTIVCKFDHRCPYCGRKISAGARAAREYETNSWLHPRCLAKSLRFKGQFSSHQ